VTQRNNVKSPVPDDIPTEIFAGPVINELEIERLAATHAAIDPTRTAWRSDILLSACVELLSAKGEMTQTTLLAGVNALWKTTAVTAPQLAATLEQAKSAGLVRRISDVSDIEKWVATETAKAESKTDLEWVEKIIRAFRQALGDRIELLHPGEPAPPSDRVAEHLLHLLTVGAQGTFTVGNGIGSTLRPLQFDGDAVEKELSKLQPKQRRRLVKELLDAVMDPGDDLGNDVLHMLVVGNILRGVLTKRDVMVGKPLDGVRLLLDTSSIVDLISDGLPTKEVLEQVLELTTRTGATVIVAEHTIEEWRGVWDAADAEMARAKIVDDVDPHLHYFAGNPFVSEYLRRRSQDSALTWERFRIGIRDLQQFLKGYDIEVRPAYNDTTEDENFHGRFFEEFARLDASLPKRPRKRKATQADAASCTMLARWRRKGTAQPAAAYFLAKDSLTGRVYKTLVPSDTVPLVVNPAGWLAYVAAMVTDDPKKRTELAEMLGSAVVRESFFKVANRYTANEALELSQMLVKDNKLSPHDVRTIVQMDFTDLLNGNEATANDRALAAAGSVLRRRNEVANERAQREVEEAALLKQEAMTTQQRSTDVVKTKEAELGNLHDRLAESERQRQEDVEGWRRRYSRMMRTVGCAVTAVSVVIVLYLLVDHDVLRGNALLLAVAGAGWMAVEAVRFCRNVDTPVGAALYRFAAATAMLVISSLAGAIVG
jgi:hypothetical protein